MSSNYIIRQACESDYQYLCDLFTAEYLDADYSLEDIARIKNTQHDPAITAQKIIEESKRPDSRTRGWLAIADRQAVGVITTKDINGGVFVDSAFRGQGIGKALGAARSAFVHQHGLDDIAHIEANNAHSLRTFQRLGYTFNEATQQEINKAEKAGINLSEMTGNDGRPALLVLEKSP